MNWNIRTLDNNRTKTTYKATNNTKNHKQFAQMRLASDVAVADSGHGARGERTNRATIACKVRGIW